MCSLGTKNFVVPIPQQHSLLVACVRSPAGLCPLCLFPLTGPQSLSVYKDVGVSHSTAYLAAYTPVSPISPRSNRDVALCSGPGTALPYRSVCLTPSVTPGCCSYKKTNLQHRKEPVQALGALEGLSGSCLEILFMGKAGDRAGRRAAWEMPGCAASKASRPFLSSGPSMLPLPWSVLQSWQYQASPASPLYPFQSSIHLPRQRAEKTPASLGFPQFIFYSGEGKT